MWECGDKNIFELASYVGQLTIALSEPSTEPNTCGKTGAFYPPSVNKTVTLGYDRVPGSYHGIPHHVVEV